MDPLGALHDSAARDMLAEPNTPPVMPANARAASSSGKLLASARARFDSANSAYMVSGKRRRSHRDTFGIEPICKVLRIAPSGDRRHAAQLRDPSRRCARTKRDEILQPEIKACLAGRSYTCGRIRGRWPDAFSGSDNPRVGCDIAVLRSGFISVAASYSAWQPRRLPIASQHSACRIRVRDAC